MTLKEIQNEIEEIRTEIRKLNKRSEQLFLLREQKRQEADGQMKIDDIL